MSGFALIPVLLAPWLILTGCGGGSSPSSSTSSGGGTSAPPVSPTAKSIYVIQQSTSAADQISSAILEFSASASGSATPVATITPPANVAFYSVTLDNSGNIYASGTTLPVADAVDAILVYPAGANGSMAPTRTITEVYPYGLTTPGNLAVDASGNIFLEDASAVDVYGPTLTGTTGPTRSIDIEGRALTFDSSGDLYQNGNAGAGVNAVNVYVPDPSEFPTPIRSITDAADATGGLDGFIGLAVGADGSIYTTVQNISLGVDGIFYNQIAVYPPGANGKTEPVRTISGPTTTLNSPTGIAVDSAGFIYVVDSGGPAGQPQGPWIKVFSPTANGDVAPVSIISSSQWTDTASSTIAIR